MERGPSNAWWRKTTRAQTLISVEEGLKSRRWREVFEADGWRTSPLPETGHRGEQQSGLHDAAVRSKRAIEERRRSGGCQTRAGEDERSSVADGGNDPHVSFLPSWIRRQCGVLIR
jgi:hypothetical protein